MSVLRAMRRTRVLRCDYYYDAEPTAVELFAARAMTALGSVAAPAKQKVDKHEHLSHYSAVGYWSVFSIRQRFHSTENYFAINFRLQLQFPGVSELIYNPLQFPAFNYIT